MWSTLRSSLVFNSKLTTSLKAASWFAVQRQFTVSYRADQCDKSHVCIVGSGPAGFYTAQQVLKVRL